MGSKDCYTDFGIVLGEFQTALLYSKKVCHVDAKNLKIPFFHFIKQCPDLFNQFTHKTKDIRYHYGQLTVEKDKSTTKIRHFPQCKKIVKIPPSFRLILRRFNNA